MFSTLYLYSWEETKNTSPMNKNNLPNTEPTNYIIYGTEKPSDARECENIWRRNCPRCDKLVNYTSKSMYEIGLNKNSLCRSCNAKAVSKTYLLGKTLSGSHRKKCSVALSGKSNPMFGKSHSKKTSIKISETKMTPTTEIINRECPSCKKAIYYKNKKCMRKAALHNKSCFTCSHSTKEYRMELRKRTIERLKKRGCWVSYNELACKYFDDLNAKTGWNLRHALNGGEIEIVGYFPDAYDKNENVIVEYDEPKHYDVYGNLKQKDVIRMNEIIEETGCRFYRYNQKTDEFRLYNSSSIDSMLTSCHNRQNTDFN